MGAIGLGGEEDGDDSAALLRGSVLERLMELDISRSQTIC